VLEDNDDVTLCTDGAGDFRGEAAAVEALEAVRLLGGVELTVLQEEADGRLALFDRVGVRPAEDFMNSPEANRDTNRAPELVEDRRVINRFRAYEYTKCGLDQVGLD